MLASVMAGISSTGMASMDSDGANAAPRPESYASYSLYIQALFNYQKTQDKEKSAARKKSCPPKGSDEPNGLINKDECMEQGASANDIDHADNNQHESLEDAISKSTPDISRDYASNSIRPRSTFSSFPLNPITAQDLSKTGVSGLLGFFNSLVLQSQTSTAAETQSNNNNGSPTNIDPRISNDINSLLYTQIVGETLAMGGNLVLRDGSGHVDVTGKIVGTGLQLELSSHVRTGLYIVDRDGYPGSYFDKAGAVVVNSMGIDIPNMLVNIQGVNNTGNNADLIKAQLYSSAAITVDLSGTTIGAADAVRDGSKIGIATDFIRFGPDSVMTIAPGMSMNTTLSRPNGTTTPFITLNGNIGTISLKDISLMDNGASVFNIGMLSVTGIQLVNAQVFIDGQKIIVDAGTGIKNASISLERLSFGDTLNATLLGDLYVNHINVVNTRMTVEAH